MFKMVVIIIIFFKYIKIIYILKKLFLILLYKNKLKK
jgi:hypothetical protein